MRVDSVIIIDQSAIDNSTDKYFTGDAILSCHENWPEEDQALTL